MKALSIQQPWAWAILHAGKPVENRSWTTSFRGECLLHAGKTVGRLADFDANVRFIKDAAPAAWPALKELVVLDKHGVYRPTDRLPRGGFVGRMRVVDCLPPRRLIASQGNWRDPMQFGLVLEQARPVPFVKALGALFFFEVDDYVADKVPWL